MSKKIQRRATIVGLLVIALIFSTATFAYWANFVEGTVEESNNQLTIGSADSVDTIFELSNDFNSGGYLVPLNQLVNSPENSVDEVNLTYDIKWVEDEYDSMLDGTIVEGKIDITHTVFIMTDNGILDHVRYANVYNLIKVEYNDTNPSTLILNGDGETLAFKITIDESSNKTEYELISNHSLNIAFEFKIADSNIDINDQEEPSYIPEPEIPDEDSMEDFKSQIVLNGSENILVELGEMYIDLGAVAYDSNGNIISNVWNLGYVDTWKVGIYNYQYFSYSSEDYLMLFSNIRTIEVVDTTEPEIIINGDEVSIVQLGSYYSDWGAYALDDSGSVEVIVTGAEDVDINQVGSYLITYTATDINGNTSTAIRTVEVTE